MELCKGLAEKASNGDIETIGKLAVYCIMNKDDL